MAAMWKDRWAYILLAPFTICWIAFYLVPMVRLVSTSFYRSGIKRSEFVGLQNFIDLASDDLFWTDLYNTIVIVIVLVPVVIAIALIVSLIANEMSPRWQAFIRLAFYIPVVASSVVLAVLWLNIYRPVGGILNNLIGLFGIPPVVWLGTIETALPSVIVVLVSFSLGVPIILFLAGLAAIPMELYEAAEIDGASRVAQARYISVPLLRPTLLFVAVTQTISASQVFALVQILTQGGPVNSTDTLVFRIYRDAFVHFDFGYASAITIVLLGLVSAAAFVQFRAFGQDVQY
jgi:multiple sugar transport system permease protein